MGKNLAFKVTDPWADWKDLFHYIEQSWLNSLFVPSGSCVDVLPSCYFALSVFSVFSSSSKAGLCIYHILWFWLNIIINMIGMQGNKSHG